MQSTNNHDVSPEELPQPRLDYAPQGPVNVAPNIISEKQRAQTMEAGVSNSPGGQLIYDPQTVTNYSATATNDSQTTSDNSTTASPHSPPIADDADLIEKEWVAKAKHIVDQTKDDPFNQTREINKMKADYLKKRYAKDLKLPED
ncbi:MAG: hypothetical protein NVS1B7_2920 [Candidatus Saccharimonadales bacterium]